jgi:hypothetical protein
MTSKITRYPLCRHIRLSVMLCGARLTVELSPSHSSSIGGLVMVVMHISHGCDAHSWGPKYNQSIGLGALD